MSAPFVIARLERGSSKQNPEHVHVLSHYWSLLCCVSGPHIQPTRLVSHRGCMCAPPRKRWTHAKSFPVSQSFKVLICVFLRAGLLKLKCTDSYMMIMSLPQGLCEHRPATSGFLYISRSPLGNKRISFYRPIVFPR